LLPEIDKRLFQASSCIWRVQEAELGVLVALSYCYNPLVA
jgi:hypothetical protein